MSKKGRPNILFILTDQQRYDTIGANGNSQIFTPNLDRLSAEGVVFERAYTSSPECVPARGVMMTGQMPHRTGCYSNGYRLPPESVTFQRLLRQAGYVTQSIGKMHFVPAREGFGMEHLTLSEEIPESVQEDEFLTDLQEAGFDWAEEPHGMRSHMYYIPQVSQLPDSLHTTTWTGDRTVDFIRDRSADEDKPWLCWTGFIKPHPPFDPTVPFNTLYDPIEMPLPVRGADDESSRNWYQKIQNLGKWMDQGPDVHLQQAQKAHYWALVSMVDVQVGRILAELEATGQRDNTLIIFSSDHGEFLGDHGCYGKRSWHEGPGRIPMIVNWPQANLPAGQRRSHLVSHEDILPTILEAAGVDKPANCNGLSLLELARQDDPASGREVLFGQLGEKEQGLYLAMDDQWKYIYCAMDNTEQHWHYAADPSESTNHAADPSKAEVKARLKAALMDYFAREGYQAPAENGDWRPYTSGETDFERTLQIGKTCHGIKAGYRQYAAWNDRRKNVFKPEGRMFQ